MIERSSTPAKRLQETLSDQEAFCITWNRGWLTWKVLTNEDVRIFYITSAWSSPKTTLSETKKTWKKVLRIAKNCNCKIMRIKTARNPKTFERKYGFKTVIRTMDKKL